MPPLKVVVQGFGGSVGAKPACVCCGSVKSRTSGARSAAGVPGGSASYAWSEKTTSPSLPSLRDDAASVAADPRDTCRSRCSRRDRARRSCRRRAGSGTIVRVSGCRASRSAATTEPSTTIAEQRAHRAVCDVPTPASARSRPRAGSTLTSRAPASTSSTSASARRRSAAAATTRARRPRCRERRLSRRCEHAARAWPAAAAPVGLRPLARLAGEAERTRELVDVRTSRSRPSTSEPCRRRRERAGRGEDGRGDVEQPQACPARFGTSAAAARVSARNGGDAG